MITKEQVKAAQEKWGSGVVKIGALRDKRPECKSYASEFLDLLYAFEKGPVLFKPTKCAVEQFRPSTDITNMGRSDVKMKSFHVVKYIGFCIWNFYSLFLLLQEKKRILIFARTNRRRRVEFHQ